MKRKQINKKNDEGFLTPNSLETLSNFSNRFVNDFEMKYLLPNVFKRKKKANSLFNEYLKKACVTVKLCDGTIYFIE